MTSQEKITGQEYIKLACKSLQRPYNGVTNLSKFSVGLLGLFVPVLREFVEMMYQFESDYIFDSSKMEESFQIKPTPYNEGIDATLKS